MTRYAKTMSQTLAEMKMNDPKLIKIFDKLKKGSKIKIKHDSVLEKGTGYISYTVTAKNIVGKGKRFEQEKITLRNDDNPTGVKKFLYKRDDKVTMAAGDMAVSIADIKENLEEGYEKEVLNVLSDAGIDGYFRNGKLYVDKRDAKDAKAALEDADNIIKLPKMVKEEVEDLDEAIKYTHAAVDKKGLVIGFSSKESDAKDMARRNKGRVVTLTKPLAPKKGDMMVNRPFPDEMDKFPTNTSATQGKRMEENELDEASARADAMRAMGRGRKVDPADIDEPRANAIDKASADKNMVMQMRKVMDVKGNATIEFGNGKKEKVDPKIVKMMLPAHDKIEKPRDKEKFLAMISKSKRDMLNVAKKLSTLKMELDKEDEPLVKKVVDMLKKASNAHAGQAKDLEKAIKETLDIKEGTWKMPDNPKEVAALKKLMSRPLPIGNTEDDKMYKDSASAKLYGLLGDDELFDALGALEDKGKEKADARPVIIKWFQKRVKDNSYDLGDETKTLGKQIGLKMEYVPEAYKPVKANHYDVKIQGVKKKDVNAILKYIKVDGGNYDIEDVDADQVTGGGMSSTSDGDIFIQGDDAGKLGMEIAKKFRGVKVMGEGVELDENKDVRKKYKGKEQKAVDMMIMRNGVDSVQKTHDKDPKKFDAMVKRMSKNIKEEVELDEKYDLYHKTFSDAMQHAYDYAKKKLGITVDPKEIDNKVATGPKKPSEGKTNKYRLKGKGGNLQIQVYNKGGSKPFELNMYKEENEMTKSLKDTIVEMWSEAVSPAQQAAIAISKKEKEEKDEGNAFGAALKAARDNGDDTFMVSGKKYKVEDYKDTKEKKLDPVGKEDGDIDNDGDKDATDKYLAKRRKAISKAIKKDKKESFERYHETKQGSLRDAVLQMWGEEIKEKKTLTKEKKDGIKSKMTDTGKEVTPVELSPKMPKVKESKNKV